MAFDKSFCGIRICAKGGFTRLPQLSGMDLAGGRLAETLRFRPSIKPQAQCFRHLPADLGASGQGDVGQPRVPTFTNLDWLAVAWFASGGLFSRWPQPGLVDYRRFGFRVQHCNIGSDHIVGLAGSGAKDGVAMAHYFVSLCRPHSDPILSRLLLGLTDSI